MLLSFQRLCTNIAKRIERNYCQNNHNNDNNNLFGFSWNILWKNPNELFGQLNISNLKKIADYFKGEVAELRKMEV